MHSILLESSRTTSIAQAQIEGAYSLYLSSDLSTASLQWAAAAAESLLSCPTPCDPTDGSPPGSSVLGILQAGILEWVAIYFSNACMHANSLQSCPTLRPYGQQPARLLRPQDSLGKNTGVGCHFFLCSELYHIHKACWLVFVFIQLWKTWCLREKGFAVLVQCSCVL